MTRPTVNLLGWVRYYTGRTLELMGFLLVTNALVLYFGSSDLGAMLNLTGAGVGVFFLGWLAARKNPEGK